MCLCNGCHLGIQVLIGYWKYVHTAVQVQVQIGTGLVLQDRCAGNSQRQYRSVVHHLVMWPTNGIMPPPFIGSRMYVYVDPEALVGSQ